MNIGIVIGVSEYTDADNNLPGCKKDAQYINEILRNSNKYEKIFFVNKKLPSAKIKEKLRSFISELKSIEIEEAFFYFTGHGEFYNNEFYFILSDFSENRRKQTSLQNNEVDILLKSISPKLAVKIIDACQSGKNYIKEPKTIKSYFEKSQNNFNKCYFMNSSHNNQSSYQTDEVSDFTISFINAIREHESEYIRYKDITDYISDDFERNASQTPFFVTQADLTEKFCIVTPALKNIIKSFDLYKSELISDKKSDSPTLLDKVKKDAGLYLNKQEALEFVNNLRIQLMDFSLPDEINDIYDLEFSVHTNYQMIINKTSIGRWLEENDHDYFATSSYTRKRVRNINPLSSLANLTYNEGDYESVMSGFDLNIDVPYKTIIFNANSKFPNINSYTCRIIYLLSKSKIGFFYFITNFIEKNWDERELNENAKWEYLEFHMSKNEEVKIGLRTITDHFEQQIMGDIAKYLD